MSHLTPEHAPRTDLVPGTILKGHGTQNDFVLIFDPEGELNLSAEKVRELADRHTGIGADGVIRIVATAQSGHAADPADHVATHGEAGTEDALAGAHWFMDYRNADGSVAEMCGNGVRVFAHVLVTYGLVPFAAQGTDTSFAVGTRAGTKNVRVIADPTGGSGPWYRVDMGPWTLPGLTTGAAIETMTDAMVETTGLAVPRPGLTVDMGNPHTVLALAAEAELAGLDLTKTPRVSPEPPNGTNVEYIVVEPDGDPTIGTLSMRVHERGVGETRACGTGACASALAAAQWGGPGSPTTWLVQQPGGTVQIEIETSRVFLSGPAELVFRAELSKRP